jgi:hypothetical protein
VNQNQGVSQSQLARWQRAAHGDISTAACTLLDCAVSRDGHRLVSVIHVTAIPDTLTSQLTLIAGNMDNVDVGSVAFVVGSNRFGFHALGCRLDPGLRALHCRDGTILQLSGALVVRLEQGPGSFQYAARRVTRVAALVADAADGFVCKVNDMQSVLPLVLEDKAYAPVMVRACQCPALRCCPNHVAACVDFRATIASVCVSVQLVYNVIQPDPRLASPVRAPQASVSLAFPSVTVYLK